MHHSRDTPEKQWDVVSQVECNCSFKGSSQVIVILLLSRQAHASVQTWTWGQNPQSGGRDMLHVANRVANHVAQVATCCRPCKSEGNGVPCLRGCSASPFLGLFDGLLHRGMREQNMPEYEIVFSKLKQQNITAISQGAEPFLRRSWPGSLRVSRLEAGWYSASASTIPF